MSLKYASLRPVCSSPAYQLVDLIVVLVVRTVDGALLSESVQVKAPLLMLLGGADLRVPASNGLQVHLLQAQGIYSNSSWKTGRPAWPGPGPVKSGPFWAQPTRYG